MKPSMFNISIDHPQTVETILFNTLYGSFTVWEPDEFEMVRQLLKGPFNISVPKIDRIKSQLIERKYLIDDDIDEVSIVKNRKTQGMKDSNRLDVVIMPNMNCNFACPYCYESHNPSSLMNDETEEAIKKWLWNEVRNFKVVLLHWFGGEPILSYRRIISIGKFARELSDSHNVGLMTNITSNGYLLDKNKIKALIAAGIINYQVTVDGPPEVHNKTRVLKTGGGTFQKVFNNILLLARADNRVRVSLRVNFNHLNFYYIPELLNLFPEDIRPALRVIYEPIFGEKCLSATENIKSEEISAKMTEYYRLAQKMGYDVILGGIGTGKLVYCYAERENQVIINYNGDIYKCSVCGFRPEERVGFLNKEGNIVYDEEKLGKWVDASLFDEGCYSCKFLPLCMGGCRKTRIEHANTGSHCSLMPGNASYALKAVAFENFEELLCGKYVQSSDNVNLVK